MTTVDLAAEVEKQLAAACPPSWEHEQWERFTFLLREWWSEPVERWTPRRIMGLALGMADFTPAQAGDALRRLRDAGSKFPPRVPEIANAIHVDRSAPSWTEAYALLFERPDGVIHARIPRDVRPVGEAARWEAREQAMLERAAALHPLIGAFVAAYGARRLETQSGRLAEGEYAAVELQRLREEWEEFVERADARRREGMPLLTEPLARRSLTGGPRRLNPLSHLIAASSGTDAPVPEDPHA